MKVVRSFPHEVVEIENLWIPVADGVRLAARVWMPVGAEAAPVPAIVEYLPYRKRDGTRGRDEPMHSYFAGHGYASIRIDLRGTGDSDGLLLDEYLEQEQLDGVAALEWIAKQRWCSGRVGMIGKSWGGFNALQIAALAPPELGAIITVCSTDDRYADDAHYMGGCLLNENLTWGSVLFTFNALPPDPAIVGEHWRDKWLERLKAAVLFPEVWLEHPTRDDYWKHGSVAEDFSAIRCPVYAVGGWADGYSNAVSRLLAGLEAPAKGLIGPWAHVYPHNGVPGPAIGFLQEALRWWDRWLKDVDNGIEDEPSLRAWMQSTPPASAGRDDDRPGRWVTEEVCPSPRIRGRRLAFAAAAGGGTLARSDAGDDGDAATDLVSLSVLSPAITGLEAGSWCGFGVAGDEPGDQRADDGRSLVFDSEPLEEDVEILGAVKVRLRVSVDKPFGLVVVRLNEVDQEGRSTRVTYGVLNLTHRMGHERPQPTPIHEAFDIELELNDIAHRFARGTRVRAALSTSYWPMIWPSPAAVTLTVYPAGCDLTLPTRTSHDADLALAPFGPPESAPGPLTKSLGESVPRRAIERDLRTGETIYITSLDADEAGEPVMDHIEAIGLTYGHAMTERFFIHPDRPLSARVEIEQHAIYQRDEWSTEVKTRIDFTSTVDSFLLNAELIASEGDEVVFSKSWSREIARKFL